MFRMHVSDHFYVVCWTDEYGLYRDELFDSEEAALRFAAAMEVDAWIVPPVPASVFVDDQMF